MEVKNSRFIFRVLSLLKQIDWVCRFLDVPDNWLECLLDINASK